MHPLNQIAKLSQRVRSNVLFGLMTSERSSSRSSHVRQLHLRLVVRVAVVAKIPYTIFSSDDS
jgi:hypothetical protein